MEELCHWLLAALAGELVFTFPLRFVGLMVATTSKPLAEYFGLVIGACVIVDGCAIRYGCGTGV